MAEAMPSLKVAARIVVTPRAVSLPPVVGVQGFDWIPAPSRGLSVEILLVLTSFVPFHGHPGDASGFELLNFRVVPPGAFWLVYKTGRLRDSGSHQSRKVFSTTADEPGPGWRAIVLADESDGSRSFLELVVG